jgi:TatD DNase family protein
MSTYTFIDCHSHPHDEKYQAAGVSANEVLERLARVGGATIAIGTDYANSKRAIDLAVQHENCFATIGIHPADNHSEVWDEARFDEMYMHNLPQSLLSKEGSTTNPKVVGIGECGLDYFYFDKINWQERGTSEAEEIARQKVLFIHQIEYALTHNLPLVLHGRPRKNSMDAYRDMLDILESYKKEYSNLRGHAHFFVGNLEIAERFLALGFLLSFDGPITFTIEYDEVIRQTPLEMIMIETDSPYAAPAPYRGQTNYPEYVIEVAKKIATLKSASTEEVLEVTKNNAIRLFDLKQDS